MIIWEFLACISKWLLVNMFSLLLFSIIAFVFCCINDGHLSSSVSNNYDSSNHDALDKTFASSTHQIFSHERKWYNRKELARHRAHGDPDDTSHRGHPLCKFCDDRYLDNDELLKHLRRDHYFCHFCDADGSQEYYRCGKSCIFSSFFAIRSCNRAVGRRFVL